MKAEHKTLLIFIGVVIYPYTTRVGYNNVSIHVFLLEDVAIRNKLVTC